MFVKIIYYWPQVDCIDLLSIIPRISKFCNISTSHNVCSTFSILMWEPNPSLHTRYMQPHRPWGWCDAERAGAALVSFRHPAWVDVGTTISKVGWVNKWFYRVTTYEQGNGRTAPHKTFQLDNHLLRDFFYRASRVVVVAAVVLSTLQTVWSVAVGSIAFFGLQAFLEVPRAGFEEFKRKTALQK